jgi:outer membrane lipase/esterase
MLWMMTVLGLLMFGADRANASNPGYDAVVVFGDSYSDVGNIFFATGGTIPGPPYYNGRFSNGPLWVEHLASGWGLLLTPSLKGGTDYAFGGAMVTAPVVLPGGTIPSVPQQVAQYLSDHKGKADPKALYILTGGGNDILNATGGSPATLGFQIAVGLAGAEFLLRQAGAKNFLMPIQFDLSVLPEGKANAAFLSAAVIAENNSLNALLAVEQLIEGIKIHRPNVFGLMKAVQTDATFYGFTDITNPCLNVVLGTVCTMPAYTLFWDAEHPTVFAHSFFAVAAETNLNP